LNNKSENVKQHNNILIGPPGYALAPDLKKTFPDRKNQVSYAGFA